MKYLIILLALSFSLFAGIVQTAIVGVDKDSSIATIKIGQVDIGMSGFVLHTITADHEVILKSATVVAFNKDTHIATLALSDYKGLKNSALPHGTWSVTPGDKVVLAFAYTRGLLIAPNEDIYYKISRGVKIEWIHPDIFATLLSADSHPTPLKEDFEKLSDSASVGLLFFFINKELIMVDAHSFKILGINNTPFGYEKIHLPFYSRVAKIDSSWWNFWSDGNQRLSDYNSHYLYLLKKNNPNNHYLDKIIKEGLK